MEAHTGFPERHVCGVSVFQSSCFKRLEFRRHSGVCKVSESWLASLVLRHAQLPKITVMQKTSESKVVSHLKLPSQTSPSLNQHLAGCGIRDVVCRRGPWQSGRQLQSWRWKSDLEARGICFTHTAALRADSMRNNISRSPSLHRMHCQDFMIYHLFTLDRLLNLI